MTIERKVGMGIAGQPSGGATDVAEVFSTHLYTGNATARAITNGIDLAGEGGMVWTKGRSNGTSHYVHDTERGTGNLLYTENTSGESTGNSTVTNFNNNGFSIGNVGSINGDGRTYASWTFRKKEKFFDVVSINVADPEPSSVTINHNLGQQVGMVIMKSYLHTYPWHVMHRSLTNKHLVLNDTDAEASNGGGPQYSSTSTTITIPGAFVHSGSSNGKCILYLFADNSSEDADDQIIKCGSFTEASSGSTTTVNLGWEPQWVIAKSASDGDNWHIIDSMRGFTANASGNSRELTANGSGAEGGGTFMRPTSTGFIAYPWAGSGGGKIIYMAIRAPMMKEPEAATDVFAVDTMANQTPAFDSGFPVDMAIRRNTDYATSNAIWSRLTGEKYMNTDSAGAASNDSEAFDYMNGWGDGSTYSGNHSWMFKRAKGFMDVVCYFGNGSSTSNVVKHSLGVAPEIIMIKKYNGTGDWHTYVSSLGLSSAVFLNDTSATQANGAFTGGVIDSTQFEIKVDYGNLNTSGGTYIAYLFATLAGISKVGSYTGNGSSQTISCGFSAGSRFILIKRTDSSGDWYIWDTTRGIVAGNDPHLSLNTTAAQVTSDDSIDPANSGFIVNQVSAANINVSSGTYIFYAIA